MKKTQERFCGAAFSLPLHLHLSLARSPSLARSLFLARHLTSPGKRQIRFRLLSRQSKPRKSFFFSPSPSSPPLLLLPTLAFALSVSLPPFSFPFSVFASFPWMQSCEGRLHAFQTITVHPHSPPPPPPPPAHCELPLCQSPAHASTSFGEP